MLAQYVVLYSRVIERIYEIHFALYIAALKAGISLPPPAALPTMQTPKRARARVLEGIAVSRCTVEMTLPDRIPSASYRCVGGGVGVQRDAYVIERH